MLENVARLDLIITTLQFVPVNSENPVYVYNMHKYINLFDLLSIYYLFAQTSLFLCLHPIVVKGFMSLIYKKKYMHSLQYIMCNYV